MVLIKTQTYRVLPRLDPADEIPESFLVTLNGRLWQLVQAGGQQGEGGAEEAQLPSFAPHGATHHTCSKYGRAG
jgi:hypothetical protein